MKKEKIIIIGAGLAGSLLALTMAKKGFEVVVYERRPDLRKVSQDAGRSINLALSDRGLQALNYAGLDDEVRELCIPMNGRMIHVPGHENRFSPYSGRPSDYINSISRPGLNAMLLDQAEQCPNVSIHFDHKCTKVDLQIATVECEDLITGHSKIDKGTVVFGTDGAGSSVRKAIMDHTNQLNFNYSQNFLTHGYKELEIKPGYNNTHVIEKNALHIWPRTSHMIIALPNLDGSFTVTMFHPYDGEVGFNTLTDDQKVEQMFESEYPELIDLIPHYQSEYFENPTSNLGTIRCSPWQAYGKALLMGDAAHAIVPFYGQGMNASLEDVFVFNQLLDKGIANWEDLFITFQDSRIPNANAIADLALDNFYEMRDHVDDELFVLKRKLEMKLENQTPDYFSKYSLVTFREDIGYHEAMIRGRKQDQLLLHIVKENPNPEVKYVLDRLSGVD